MKQLTNLKDLPSTLLVLDFWAEWCKPCEALKPYLSVLETQYPDIPFYSVDVDKEYKIAEEYRVKSIPTLIVVEDGKEIYRTTLLKDLHHYLEVKT